MIKVHQDDFEVLCNLLQVEELPEDIEREYDLRRRLYHAAGGSGPLRALALVDLLRFLGYGRRVNWEQGSVDWRNYEAGEPIVAEHGGKQVPGKLDGVTEHGYLTVYLDGVQGLVELPRHAVRLGKQTGVSVDKIAAVSDVDWSTVGRNAKVLVMDGGADDYKKGRFIGVGDAPGRLRIQIAGKEQSVASSDAILE